MWVNDGTVYAASGVTDKTPVLSPWAGVNSQTSSATPAVARNGNTIYMAVQSGPNDSSNTIYWTSSTDGGSTWAAWQALPSTMTSTKPPSLAVVNGTLYLSYLGLGNNEINITSLTDATNNSWSPVYQIPGQSASYASLLTESVGGNQQLAVYFVSNDPSSRILKTYSTTPAQSSGWSNYQVIQYSNGAANQTASGPLAVSQYNGQTYVAYQGGVIGTPATQICLATSSSANINNGANWVAQALVDPSTATGIGLTNTANGLLLSYGASSNTSALQLTALTPQIGSLNVSTTAEAAQPLASGLSNNIAILSGGTNNNANVLLAGINNTSKSSYVQTSLIANPEVYSSWTPPTQVLQRQESNGSVTFQPITATATPTATLLGSVPVLAVNDNGSINVYAGVQGSGSLQLSSSFTAPMAGVTILSAPVLTTTDTGLALTYTNSDGSISLNRLEFLSANGTPLPGVQVNPDGSIDTSNADLQWQSTVLTQSNSGLSTSLASTPVSVNGTLLLANVRNNSSPNDQIWINAVPNLSDPGSTTWLNSTVQLADGSGGWSISQQTGTVNIGSFTPNWTDDAGGLSPSAPVFAELNGVVYAAVVGFDTTTQTDDGTMFWNSSSDGGRTWGSWLAVPNYASNKAPALAAYQGSLYMAYVGTNSGVYIAKLTDAGSNTWSQVQAGSQTCDYIGLTSENGDLAAYYVGTNSELYRTATSTPTNGGSWSNSMVIQYSGGNQTASANLAVTTIPGSGSSKDTTYIAYQGGTPSSPGDTIYLTSSSNQSSGGSWSLAASLPQPATANRGGVSLSRNHAGLLFGYPDRINGGVVYVVKQSADSGSTWSPFTTLAAPTGSTLPSSGSNSSFALLASPTSNDVLVGAINNGSGDNDAIYTAIVSELPPSTSLSGSQTQSNISAIGDLNQDGFDDLLVAANNVVVNPSSGSPTLATGLRLISGAATSSQIQANDDANSASQTVQVAPWHGLNNSTPVASLGGSSQLSVTSTDSLSGCSQTNSTVLTSPTAFTATPGDPTTLQQVFGSNVAFASGNPTAGSPLGNLGLISAAGFGDLNADGFVDDLDPTSATVISGANNQTWTLWSLRAAGDVNGNGVDDVLLSLAPQGPAYKQVTSGQPSALQSVLLDGSLFKVDTTTNSFRLDQLKAPLNPYNRSEVYNVASTTTSDYAPSLQNWFDPILNFEPGSLSSSSISNSFNPAGAESYSPPSVVVSPQGQTVIFFSGADNFDSSKNGSGLWYVYSAEGGWVQNDISTCSNASSYAPSAAFYNGSLYVAYSDTSGDLWIASSKTPEDASSWSKYQVVTTADESTCSSPTLIAENGRLALYFPTNNSGTQQQNVRYLYSRDPASSGSWGGTLSGGAYSGISGQLEIGGSTQIVTSPIAATTYQGRTVLAFRGYNSSGAGSNIGNGTMQIATQDYTEIAGSAPSQTSGWTIYDTGLSNVNGVGLTTDQALLYLTSSGSYASFDPTTNVWSLSPTKSGSNTWNAPVRTNLSGSASLANNFTYGVMTPFLLNGRLMAAWTNSSDQIQVSTLDVGVNTPTQQSLAGYSLDGNIDINGDGFRDVLISDPSDPSESVDNQYALFGGDYLNIASQVGTPGDDTLDGTPLADVIYSLGGSDSVAANGGKDVIYTGSGDDQISIADSTFIRIDAGSGFDTLQLQGQANQAYDFRLNVSSPEYFAGTKLRDIELVSSIDYGANALSFDAAAINAINPDRILFLTPDASDTITLSSEFQRNAGFDTTFAGYLWNAYAAGDQSSPADSSPSLVYVLNPDGASADAWLAANITIPGASARGASSQAAVRGSQTAVLGAEAPVADPAVDSVTLPSPSAVASSIDFGDGLTLIAYRSDPSTGLARFAIQRRDSRRRQVISYASSSANSSAEPGQDYTAIAGLLVLEAGQSSQELTVPIDRQAFAQLRDGTLSLSVEELVDRGQSALHLLLSPDVDPSAEAAPPVLSGFELTPSASGEGASLRFRADANGSSADLASLQLAISQRSSADASDVVAAQTVSLLDAIAASGAAVPAYNGVAGALALDHDGNQNGQISGQLELNFTASAGQPSLSLSAPSLRWQPSLQRAEELAVQFLDAVPLTIWRADSGAGAVSFGLQSGDKTVTLLSDAIGGSAGSLSPDTALDDSASGWLSTEGKAVGSRGVIEGLALAGPSWRPTAIRDGQELELQDVQIDGNQITATFAGGVTAVFGQQGTGRAPAAAPIAPSVQVQRLGRYENALGFYALDTVTGAVDGLEPGDDGYLQAALARSKASGLLLTPDQLPAFGQQDSFETLPLDLNHAYGVLLLVEGDRKRIVSSFAAANPGGKAQMINLGSSSNGLVLGLEDQMVAEGSSDIDYNDAILTISHVTVPLF